MKISRKMIFIIALVSCFLLLANTSRYEVRYLPSQAIVRMEPKSFGEAKTILSGNLKAYGGRIIDSIPELFAIKVAVPEGRELSFINTVRSLDEVSFIEPNYVGKVLEKPNDPEFKQQWSLRKIKAPEAWEEETGSKKIKIAIIDTGVDYMQLDLAANYIDGVDFVDYDNDPYPSDFTENNSAFHGTHVAGIAAAATNNLLEIAGISQSGVIGIRACKGNGDCDEWAVVKGIIYAAERGANIINISLGWPKPPKLMEAACKFAYLKGSLIIAAAGNDGRYANVDYPAVFQEVIAVSATNQSDKLASFSDFGREIELAAPGVNILSLAPKQQMRFAKGTSMASPHVAGVAALLWSTNPKLTNKEVREILCARADDLGKPGRDNKFGCGRVNARKIVRSPEAGPTQPPPTAPPSGQLSIQVDKGCAPAGTGYQVGEQIQVSYSVPEDATVNLYRIGQQKIVEKIFTGSARAGTRQVIPAVTATSPGVETVVIQARTSSGKVMTNACTYSIGGVSPATAQISVDKGCGSTYYNGDRITISVTVNKTSTIKIIDFTTDGQKATIVERQVYAGETVNIRARVQGQPGKETLVLRAVTDSGEVITSSCSFNIS